jgi:prepilin-type N-terminal cleavage/methylation domain-containing protein
LYNEVSLGGIMKKGFTLIELLIVMVVLGILVTVALPKYRASLERGRAMEGITNLRAASDALNAKYIINENVYTKTGVVNSFDEFISGNIAKSRSFSAPKSTSLDNTTADVKVVREGNQYTLTAHNEHGELKYITCTGDDELCQAIGAELVNGSYMFDFR